MLEIKGREVAHLKGTIAKYWFAFLIAPNPVTGKANYKSCLNIPFLKRRGIIYNPDSKKYLAFVFTGHHLRYRDNLTKREAYAFISQENY